MKILVTGISGRIGANLAKTLLDQGHSVRGLVWEKDQRLEKLEALDVELVTGSLVNPHDVQKAVADVEVICHLAAAFQGGGPFSNQDYFDINLRGTFNILEAAHQNKQLQQFFFASSDALYEKYIPGGMPQPIQEDKTPLAPTGQYALTKGLGEAMCLGYYRTYDLPVTIMRFALVVAGDEILNFSQFYLAHWLKTYAAKSTEAARQVYADLQTIQNPEQHVLIARDEQGRSYKKHIADVHDIVLGFTSALGKPNIAGEVFQLAAPTPFTWAKTVPYLAEKLGLEVVDRQLSDNTPTYYEFDLTKSKQLLSYAPQKDIFTMIDSALAYRAEKRQ